MRTEIVQVGDLKVELPVVALPNTDISIILFDSLGKTQLIQDIVKEAIKVFTKPEVIVCPEAKTLPLAHELARTWGIDYFVFRKAKKLYMRTPKAVEVRSITTEGVQLLWYDEENVEMLKGKKVMLFDDVVSTGGTLQGMLNFMNDYNLELSSISTIFWEAESPIMDAILDTHDNFEYLCHLPLLQTVSLD